MIKTALQYLCKSIIQVFNLTLDTGIFPKSWRDGIIISVYNQGNRLEANNYRSITVSSYLVNRFVMSLMIEFQTN